jgi:ABC-2 type transport system permease protein
VNRKLFSDAWFLATKGIRMQLRARETLLWTFVMPLVFIYFIGTVTGHAFGSGDLRSALGVMVPTDAGFLADTLTDRLGQNGYRIFRLDSEEDYHKFPRRLSIPPAFTGSVLKGKAVKIQFEHTGDDANGNYDQVRITRVVYGVLADLIVASRNQAGVTPAALAAINAEPHNLTLEVKSAGKRIVAPNGFDQSVPGTMVMFTLLVMFTSGAVTLTIERRQGLLRRLASTPMSRGAVVLGRWGSRMALGAVQIAFAMVAGTFLFHIHWGPNLPMVVLILLAYGALAATLGMLLGNFGRTEGQVIGMGVLLSNVLAGLGGCWWPIEITPRWAQHFALLLPTGWTMDALHKLVNFGGSPAEVLPHLAASVLGAVVLGWVLAKNFRFA